MVASDRGCCVGLVVRGTVDGGISDDRLRCGEEKRSRVRSLWPEFKVEGKHS